MNGRQNQPVTTPNEPEVQEVKIVEPAGAVVPTESK